MKRLVPMLGLALATPAAAQPVEIGYVESFDRSPDLYSIQRGDKTNPVAVLAPIYAGDRIKVADPTAAIRLRLVDRPDLVIVSQANQAAPIEAAAPRTHFVTPLFEWVGRTINVFDKEEREIVAANIRGGGGDLAAPALAKPQILAAGSQSLAIGWTGPKQVAIRLTDTRGKEIVATRGTGGLWTSPPVNLEPGRYALELRDGDKAISQSVQVVAAAEAPRPATDATTALTPELRATAAAAWLAARDEHFMLAALQRVAPYARANGPGRLLTRALVAGRRPKEAPPT